MLDFTDNDFKVSEYSHALSKRSLEIYYEAQDGSNTYPVFANLTMTDNAKMLYEITSDKTDLKEIDCSNDLKIVNTWQ